MTLLKTVLSMLPFHMLIPLMKIYHIYNHKICYPRFLGLGNMVFLFRFRLSHFLHVLPPLNLLISQYQNLLLKINLLL